MSRTWSFCTFHSPLKFQPAGRENGSGNFEKGAGSDLQGRRRCCGTGSFWQTRAATQLSNARARSSLTGACHRPPGAGLGRPVLSGPAHSQSVRLGWDPREGRVIGATRRPGRSSAGPSWSDGRQRGLDLGGAGGQDAERWGYWPRQPGPGADHTGSGAGAAWAGAGGGVKLEGGKGNYEG